MLLNLSNHPSAQWSERQTTWANDIYGEVEDLPFPQIDPNFNEVQLDALVKEYFSLVARKKPNAVHIMGELTFCVALIKKLQNGGISCIASTTHRSTEDLPDGTKVSKFEFVRFRQYWP